MSLGLLNNHSPLLSFLHLLHPLLYLHYFQVCYDVIHPSISSRVCLFVFSLLISCIVPGINTFLTIQVAIVKSGFQSSFVNDCFSSFRGWLLGFGTKYFYGVGLSAQPSTWRSRVPLFLWIIALDLSGMESPTSSIRYCQHLGFVWPHKPLHYVKEGIPSERKVQCMGQHNTGSAVHS